MHVITNMTTLFCFFLAKEWSGYCGWCVAFKTRAKLAGSFELDLYSVLYQKIIRTLKRRTSIVVLPIPITFMASNLRPIWELIGRSVWSTRKHVIIVCMAQPWIGGPRIWIVSSKVCPALPSSTDLSHSFNLTVQNKPIFSTLKKS